MPRFHAAVTYPVSRTLGRCGVLFFLLLTHAFRKLPASEISDPANMTRPNSRLNRQ